jgi:hypothetical protein
VIFPWRYASLSIHIRFAQMRSMMQAQRLQMKLYRQLQLQPDQRAAMAERWRSWCRRRRGLDTQLSLALQQLQVHAYDFCTPIHLLLVAIVTAHLIPCNPGKVLQLYSAAQGQVSSVDDGASMKVIYSMHSLKSSV